MKIENLETTFPTLYNNALVLHERIMPVAVAIVTIGISLRVWRGTFGDAGEMLRAILTGAIIAISISLFPEWMNGLQIAAHEVTIDFGADPASLHKRFAELIVSTEKEGDGSIGLWDIIWSDDGGIGEAIAYALVYLASQVAWAISYLYFLVQQCLLIYGIALSPVFLAFYILNSMKGVASKYLLKLVSVSLWPLGWSIAGVVTETLMEVYAGGDDSIWISVQSFFLVIALTIWILFSTIKAPLLISQLLSEGVNTGVFLLGGFMGSLGQGFTSAVGAGVSTHMLEGNRKSIYLSAATASTVGIGTHALGTSNMLISSAIGLAYGLAGSSKKGSGDYSEQAQKIYQDRYEHTN